MKLANHARRALHDAKHLFMGEAPFMCPTGHTSLSGHRQEIKPYGVTGLDVLRALVIENIDWIVSVTRTSPRQEPPWRGGCASTRPPAGGCRTGVLLWDTPALRVTGLDALRALGLAERARRRKPVLRNRPPKSKSLEPKHGFQAFWCR